MVMGGHRKAKGLWLLSLALLVVSGCSAPQLYNINMRYEPTRDVQPIPKDGRQYRITVSSLIDQRKVTDTVLIGQVIRGGGAPIPILPRYVKPVDAVTAALRSLMTQAGYAIAPDRPAWDLQEATIRPEWGILVVGGTVDELDIGCRDQLTQTSYNARARVTLVFADCRNKRIFYLVSAESSSQLDHILFSEERLESQLNGVLSDVLEKIIEAPEMNQRVQEVLRQS